VHMRKRLINPKSEDISTRSEDGLDVERAALVEFTSEDQDYPVESAFIRADGRGWRAATLGIQTIWLIFDHPQKLKCISLVHTLCCLSA
jgi:hypothetical protein